MEDFTQIIDWGQETEQRVEKATNLFRQGYNCSQSVTMAFADCYDIPLSLMSRLSASFGGGIGRMRETCGAACGMFMLAGMEVPTSGSEDPYPDAANKKLDYQLVQRLAGEFRAETGSLLCRELLGLPSPSQSSSVPYEATPEARTPEYYQKRPCVQMVEIAVRIFMKYLRQKYAPQD